MRLHEGQKLGARKLESFEQLLESLQKDYVESLPEKINKIKLYDIKNQVNEIKHIFHNMKGTGASYGIPEITELSTVLVQICRERPSALAWSLTLGLDLMEKIYLKRKAGQICHIQTEEKYHEILLVLAPLE